MPWKEQTTASLRREVVEQMLQEGTNIAALCRQYGISRKTAYKWLHRYREGGWEALQDASCRPDRSPHRTPEAMEDLIVEVRKDHPAWGARKIHAFLRRRGQASLPSPSTSPASSTAAGALTPARHAITALSSASRRTSPTTCGRWTSRVPSPWPTGAPATL